MSSCPVSRFRAWRWLCGALIVATLLVAPMRGLAQNVEEMREYQKKAEFIMSFTRFVEWPERKFSQPDTPFVIGVFGVDRITALLQEALQGRTIKGRPVVIRHLQNKEELRACHVLFVSRSESERLGPILGEVRKENVLTVGECNKFEGKGGVVTFFSIGGDIRFHINVGAAAREKLNISSKLLELSVPGGTGLSTGSTGSLILSEAPRQVTVR